MARNMNIAKLIEKTKKVASFFRKDMGKRNKHQEQGSVLEEPELEHSIDDNAYEYSESEKADLRKYSRALLHLCDYTEREKVFKEIADKKNADSLKKVFFPKCCISILKEKDSKENNTKEKYEKCIYKLFMLFTDKEFTRDKSHSEDILGWLDDRQKVERIIEKRDHMKMVHWMVLANNFHGAKWAFKKYQDGYASYSEFKEIFETLEDDEQDIFNYLASGIISIEKSNLSSQAEIISLVIKEFGKTISKEGEEREKKISEKIKLIKSLLLGIELTQELDKQLTISNYLEKTSKQEYAV